MHTIYYNINIIDTIRRGRFYYLFYIYFLTPENHCSRVRDTSYKIRIYIRKKEIYNTRAHALCLSLYIILHIYIYIHTENVTGRPRASVPLNSSLAAAAAVYSAALQRVNTKYTYLYNIITYTRENIRSLRLLLLRALSVCNFTMTCQNGQSNKMGIKKKTFKKKNRVHGF